MADARRMADGTEKYEMKKNEAFSRHSRSAERLALEEIATLQLK